MPEGPVRYELRDAIGVIQIENPPVNALSQPVRAGLMTALEQGAGDTSRAILLLCRGRTFIAGADITEFGRPPKPPFLPDVIAALESFPKPVIAAMHGNALGGGLEVAMACHYRLALEGTRLGLPEVKLGLLPGAGGTQRLPRLVGVEKALDMMLSGAPVPAAQAAQDGLVDAVVEGELEAAALAYASAQVESGVSVRPTSALAVPAPEDPGCFDRYRDQMAKRRRGQVAPGHIIDLVEAAASGTDIEAGQEAERDRFLVCRASPQSAALRHVFFAERATAKLPDIGREVEVLPVARTAVIGAGTMGAGIAMCLLNAGLPVVLLETSDDALAAGLERIRGNYEGSIKRGKLTEAEVAQRMAAISGTTDYADLGDVDLVIEAVFENMDVKREVFRLLDEHTAPGCILASNTSYLDINALAAETARPSRVIGAHFFSPAHVMKLLEVVRGAETDRAVVRTFMELGRRLGKIPVAVGVCHGFVGNRMLRAYARQAQLILLEGATPAQVDGAMEHWGMAMGPLAVGDLAGLDIGYRSRRDQGMEPGSIAEYAVADALVEQGRLGQKSGRGYYDYTPGGRQPDAAVESLIREVAGRHGIAQRQIEDAEISERLLLALVNEGAAIVEEGIAARPSDIDIVYINGYGFPAWRGGPMHSADCLGAQKVLERLEALRARTGDDCWAPAPLLERLAAEGSSFAAMN